MTASNSQPTPWIPAARLVRPSAGLACLCMTGIASATIDYNPFATIDVQHNSNVFSLPDKQSLAPGSSFEDTITHYIIGGTADFDWGGPDRLAINAQGSRFQYAENTTQSHWESRFGGLFDWRLGPVFSGTLSYTQARTLSAPGDTLSQQLELQTDRTVGGAFRTLVTPRWRVDLAPQWHQLDSPLPLFPEFGYRETSAAVSILYLGISKLTAGVRGSYLDGSFHHIVDATKYNQKSAQLTSTYAVTGLTSFDMQVGYTWRNSSLINPADATDAGVVGPQGTILGSSNSFTGALGVNRQLTVKTGVNLRAFRDVESSAAGANPQISTGVEGGIRWAPDFRFTLNLSYRYAKENIQGTQAISDFAGRNDRINAAEFSVKYQAFSWLSVRPYGSRYTRHSNLERASYNSTLVGIDFSAMLHPPK
ncbi:MAG TPA: hypothetical protein VNO35_03485 [Steroidobacteraceae bacterium]|nr:hypothetical protein [Steroidobacteraceae bacterium]